MYEYLPVNTGEKQKVLNQGYQAAKVRLPGSHNYANTHIELTNNDLSKHMLISGGIGSGKTNLFMHIVSQLQRSMGSNDIMVVFDTKGEYADNFYRNGIDCIISNDIDCSIAWNIFPEIFADGEDGHNIENNIFEIGRTFFGKRIEKSSQPFFPQAAKDIFCAILLDYSRRIIDGSLAKSECNNETFRNFLNEANPKTLRDLLTRHKDLITLRSYIESSASGEHNEQTLGVISELQQLARDILVGNFKKKGGFSIRNAIKSKRGRTVFIEYDLKTGMVVVPIYRLLFDLAFKEALGRKNNQGDVYFIIDEFRLLPKLAHIDDAVNFGRSLGVKVIAGLQSIEHLYEEYGEHGGNAIASGFSTNIAFKPNDRSTRTFITQLYGKQRYIERFDSIDMTKGASEQIVVGNVVEDWDILNLDVGEAIVGLPNASPQRFFFKLY